MFTLIDELLASGPVVTDCVWGTQLQHPPEPLLCVHLQRLGRAGRRRRIGAAIRYGGPAQPDDRRRGYEL